MIVRAVDRTVLEYPPGPFEITPPTSSLTAPVCSFPHANELGSARNLAFASFRGCSTHAAPPPDRIPLQFRRD